MGECMGLDFGTTYSVVSHLNRGQTGDALIPEPVDFGGEEKSITSMETLVVINGEGITRIGFEAAAAMRKKGAAVFKGFKMLLNCPDEEILRKRGFIGENTPKHVTTVFMSDLFEKVWEANPECRDIDKVVVGVPYVWTENGEDSRKFEVVDIVKEATGASLVEFQSEPTLACAYFVQEINKKRAEPFDGYILVIDYGGGTLDVTLCKAEVQDEKSSIRVCNSWGVGENTEGKIGNAGLAFMEKVADLLLADNDVETAGKEDKDYQSFVKFIEKGIKEQSASLKKCLKRGRYFSPDGIHYNDDVDGISAYYKGEEYYVKYSTLFRAYDESIRPVLARVLEKAKIDMDKLHIPYSDYKNGTFKIATIGGFCNFALTEKQIRSDTEWLRSHQDTLDTRYSELDEIVKPKNRELAIAYGAALNANNIVEIKRQFPYTLCFYPETFKEDENGNRIKENGRDVLIANEEEEFIMFRENDEYEQGKPVFLGIEESDDLGKMVFRKLPISGSGIPYIRRKKNRKSSRIKRPVMEMRFPSEMKEAFYIAMAMERNENLTLYVYNQPIYDSLTEEEQEDPLNKALIKKSVFPNVDKLLGSFYESH